MEYKAVLNNSIYLCHVNNNRDKLGRFANGDGDGDGMIDDIHNRSKALPASYRDTDKYKAGSKN